MPFVAYTKFGPLNTSTFAQLFLDCQTDAGLKASVMELLRNNVHDFFATYFELHPVIDAQLARMSPNLPEILGSMVADDLAANRSLKVRVDDPSILEFGFGNVDLMLHYGNIGVFQSPSWALDSSYKIVELRIVRALPPVAAQTN